MNVPDLKPRGPVTGYAHPRCYLNSTNDCSTTITREHFISRTVLEAMKGQIEFFGLPWKKPGEAQVVGIGSLVSHVLCGRHNSALSPLDTAAGRFFRALQAICEDITPRNRSLSRRGKWFLVSGEALELWGLKTLFGLYHAKLAADQAVRLIDTHTLDVRLFIECLRQRQVPAPCGLYLRATSGQTLLNIEEKISAAPLGSETDKCVTGIRIGLNGFEFEIILDPTGVNFPLLAQQTVYHPWQLQFRNRLRQHMLVMTWSDVSSLGTIADFGTEPVRELVREAKRRATGKKEQE